VNVNGKTVTNAPIIANISGNIDLLFSNGVGLNPIGGGTGMLTVDASNNLFWNLSKLNSQTLTPSNWSSYPALTGVDLGGNVLSNGRMVVTSNAFTVSNPVMFGKADTGNGNPDPADFSLLRGTWVKHDPSGNATEPFSWEVRYDSTFGWTMGTVWDSYIGIPMTLAGTPVQVVNTGSGGVLTLSNQSTGGGGFFNVDGGGNLYWGSNSVILPINYYQDFAVPRGTMALVTGGFTSNFTGSSITFTPTTRLLNVTATVCVEDALGAGDMLSFGVASIISPATPFLVTHTTVPALGMATATVTGVISSLPIGEATTLTLVGCSQSNPLSVFQSYSLTVVG
jgi:hypothetical protein